ncbi:hypothetical protein [Marinomonas foliarum]|uniref:Uncharacterized protein n=1 Tax=Marinomonas foliarum TaxID=491950 RepID=A0ABX7IQ29_9GAMM|nr:hypothetical protein [Marinomonas foliarum]QRV24427.1 hypothetical protein JSY38_02500 [Marinomonas foliarum]
MKLDNKELYDLLKRKKVSNFFHANTVATSITFIQEGGLLSRQGIEEQTLYQTPQTSDEIDKLFDVFGDIFLDTTDLHGHFSRQNHYGPVLFRFKLELLLDENLDIWVTNNNPIHWDRHSEPEENYFQSVKELARKWDDYDIQRKMFTVRKPTSPILFEYLEEIILDNPKVKISDDVSLRKESRRALKKATKEKTQLRELLTWRECGHCFCQDNYLKQVQVPELIQKFLPTYHAEFEK